MKKEKLNNKNLIPVLARRNQFDNSDAARGRQYPISNTDSGF